MSVQSLTASIDVIYDKKCSGRIFGLSGDTSRSPICRPTPKGVRIMPLRSRFAQRRQTDLMRAQTDFSTAPPSFDVKTMSSPLIFKIDPYANPLDDCLRQFERRPRPSRI